MDKLFYSIRTFTTRNFLILVILGWIAMIYFIFFASVDFNASQLLNGLKNWDSAHYIGIAENGYMMKYQYAFFPLYPLLIRFVAFFTGSFLSAGLIISLLSTITGMVLFFSILQSEFREFSKRIIVSFIFFPTSFYLLIPYSEGLFFLLSMLFFYYLKRNIFFSSIFCGLATLTRITGFALFVVLIYELYKNQDKRKYLFYFISLAPFIIYCLYLFSETRNPFYFLEAQNHWQRGLSLPFKGFSDTFLKIFSTNIDKIDSSDFINLIFAVFGIGLVLRCFRFLNLKYSIYALISIALPLFTGNLTSIPRFLVSIFPIFILIGKTRNLIWVIYLICCIFLLIYFSSKFINGDWIS